MKIVIATGGTGGHLFPAFKVADVLKDQGQEVILIGSFRGLALDKVQKSGLYFKNLNVQGLGFSNLRNSFSAIFLMIKAIGVSRMYLQKIKPNIVLGFGGYGAFPTVISAFFLKIPTLIHEQNVVPGRANAILARFVKRVAISFEQSRKFFNPQKTVLTGCPCNISREQLDRSRIFQEFQFKENLFTILVVGGSQGSHRINQEFIQTIRNLEIRNQIQVIHVAGKNDYLELKKEYLESGIPFALFEFLDKIEWAYKIADLVIARSGASTVTELAMCAVPSILIPYPHAGGHQKENAQVLAEIHLATVIEEKDLTIQTLAASIEKIIASPSHRQNFRERLKNICFPDAARRIAEEAMGLGK